MTRPEVEALYKWFNYTQDELYDILKDLLENVYEYKNVYSNKSSGIVAFGTTPIALVAHMDTVFSYPPQTFFYDQKQKVLWSPDGLGADDRAGIIMIIKLLEEGYRPTVIFTIDEEMGGLGASALAEIVPIEIMRKYVHFFIELDRQGRDEAVYYESGNKDFFKYIHSFGFFKEEGIFSDISILCPHYGIDGVNLSTGEYNGHAYNEYWNIGEWEEVYLKVRDILNETNIPRFTYIPRPYCYCVYCHKKFLKNREWMNAAPATALICKPCYDKYIKRGQN